jgi:adenosylcobinamide kinase/adenosylcobinamide-phosphate guanylyltransferase
MTALSIARSELILGGQKSGKSRRAEALALGWLAQSSSHRAVLIATAQAGDDEMRLRIARHQADRAQRVPELLTVEEPLHLAQAIHTHSSANTLIVVDCLTLWLTNWLMPAQVPPAAAAERLHPPGGQYYKENEPLPLVNKAHTAMLIEVIDDAAGPLVLVGNEIGLGVIPLGREVRAFVDALGLLNQSVAECCQRVTLMVAGLPLTLKDDT